MVEPHTPPDTLTMFGVGFQTKVISALITNLPFVNQTFDIVLPEYFDSPARKWLVKTILEYYNNYRGLPSMEVFKMEVGKIHGDEILRVSVVDQLKTVYQHISDTDLEYVQDKFLEFCKNQTLKNAITKSVDLLQAGKYNDIKVLVDKAMRAGKERNMGHDWKKDILSRMTTTARPTIPTPWDPINAITDGGLAGGELGVIAAPSGAGKSWGLTAIGAHAMKQGKKVIHFTLELNDNYQGVRYDTVFSGIEPKEIRNNIKVVEGIMAGVPGEVIIKYFPAKAATPNTLMAHLQQLHAIGYVPDLVIIDYADLLRSNERADNRYQELGTIYEELRGLAGELFVPCWTASQTQRSSIQDDVIQADKIAESYGKIMTADFVLSLSRKLDDKMSNTGRVHIIKNRFGPDGMTFPAHVNILQGLIDVYDPQSSRGILVQKQMKNGDGLVKKMLRQKLELLG